MKKILLVFVCLLIAGGVFAHPPRSVNVQIEGKQLNVVVNHPVGSNPVHYVDKVDVYVNGKKVIRQELKAQSGDDISLIYVIPFLKAEDTVKAKASCNKYGNKSKTIKIGEQQEKKAEKKKK